MLLYGLNPVLEALKAGRVTRLRVSSRSDQRMQEVLTEAGRRHVAVGRVSSTVLDRLSRHGVHQGVVADVEAPRSYAVADLVSGTSGPALIVVLDSIEDPHNVGAIVRTVDAAGAHGVVRQTRRAASLDSVAAKASAGAVSHVPIADVVNIARALEELKLLGVWTVGLAADAPHSYETVDWTLPSAIVLGAEGSGLRRLVRDRCDLLVSVPMAGSVDSLNVSVAAGVVLFEAARQRRQGRRTTDRPGSSSSPD
jgi:23S rRNA (guanosine2251-2'-O)-methyltransferase